MNLQRIDPQSAKLYKEIRLAALKSDPLSFGSTYEREALFPEEGWMRRAISLDGVDRVGFLAFENGHPCGLVACFRDGSDPAVGEVVSMWVDPLKRRKGVGTHLLGAVRAWAEQRGMKTLRLLVTNSNSAGLSLYERNGFLKTGKTEPYPHLPELSEVEMSRQTAVERVGR